MDFKNKLITLIKNKTNLKEINLEVPPSESLGDFSLPCFQLSKKLKKAPDQIAFKLSNEIKAPFIEKIETKGPYLNFFIKKELIAKEVLSKINENYGSGKDKKKTYLLEYFHANTHKGVHIGHLRNISIAEAMCKILEKDGYKVIRTNYQGDIGPHVAKCIWGYLNLKEKEPKTNKGVWLGKIYSLASKKEKKNKKIAEEIKQINNKIYNKDKEITKIWKKTRQYCLNDFNNFYKEFGVKFNRLYFESEVEGIGKKIVNELLKKKIAKQSEGAVIMDLQKYNLGIYVFLTKDGNSLYHAKDMGLAKLKQKEFKFDKSIHVTGSEQKLYFQQIFKTFELIGFKIGKKSTHIPYGLVMLPEGKMSSREGTMILFDDLKEKILEETKKLTKKKNKGLSKEEIEKRAKLISYAALKFSMINRDNNKDITFDWEKSLSFEGETGPYIQYSYARASSILRKEKPSNKINYALLNHPLESSLINLLAKYPETIEKAAKDLKPNLMANYVYNLSKKFNEYYHECNILKEEKQIKNARLVLISKVKTTIKSSLNLLGIETLEEM